MKTLFVCIIVESYSGRESTQLALLEVRFTIAEQVFDKETRICRALENFRIVRDGLHDGDNNDYRVLGRRMIVMGERRALKRELSQKRYGENLQ